MPGCATRCTTFSRDSIEAAWTDIRSHFGPTDVWSTASGTLAQTDVEIWNSWSESKGLDSSDVDRFGKWLVWYLGHGTIEYGNLPTRVKDHVGISCIPCPYSTASDEIKTRLWLGLTTSGTLPTQSDHNNYYMKVSQRGNTWGFECTDPNCPFKTENGHSYFHA
jgi:hypothetical protein